MKAGSNLCLVTKASLNAGIIYFNRTISSHTHKTKPHPLNAVNMTNYAFSPINKFSDLDLRSCFFCFVHDILYQRVCTNWTQLQL